MLLHGCIAVLGPTSYVESKIIELYMQVEVLLLEFLIRSNSAANFESGLIRWSIDLRFTDSSQDDILHGGMSFHVNEDIFCH